MNRREFVQKSSGVFGTLGVTILAGCNGGGSTPIKIVSSELHKNGENVLVWGTAKNTTDERIKVDDSATISAEFLDENSEVLFSGEEEIGGLPAGGEYDFTIPYRGEKPQIVEDYNVKTKLVRNDET